MLTKSLLQLVISLRDKKSRREHGLFVAEGEKLVVELLTSDITVRQIFALPEWRAQSQVAVEIIRVTPVELARMSNLETPNQVLAVAEVPTYTLDERIAEESLTLVLDGINDPGNLGTIIRTAEWFGVRHIICSKNTVDVWNPKVVQSSMGSCFRVQVNYHDLPPLLTALRAAGLRLLAGTLDGANLYEAELPAKSVLIIGSESHGVSPEVLALIDQRIKIPSYSPHIDSLNASIATSIILSEMRRRK